MEKISKIKPFHLKKVKNGYLVQKKFAQFIGNVNDQTC